MSDQSDKKQVEDKNREKAKKEREVLKDAVKTLDDEDEKRSRTDDDQTSRQG